MKEAIVRQIDTSGARVTGIKCSSVGSGHKVKVKPGLI